MEKHLPDRWHDRDLPVLRAVVTAIDGTFDGPEPSELIETTGIDEETLTAALIALQRGQYIELTKATTFGGTEIIAVENVSEKAQRATGLWPRQDEAAAALIELLDQAADSTEDEDDAGNLRKAGRLLKSVPGSVLADVTAALIRQQTGL